MAENKPDLVAGRSNVLDTPANTPMDFCEFHYVWDSGHSERRKREFAAVRPGAKYIDIRIVIDGVPIDLCYEQLMAMRRKAKLS